MKCHHIFLKAQVTTNKELKLSQNFLARFCMPSFTVKLVRFGALA